MHAGSFSKISVLNPFETLKPDRSGTVGSCRCWALAALGPSTGAPTMARRLEGPRKVSAQQLTRKADVLAFVLTLHEPGNQPSISNTADALL